jgi:hypothetical protein
LVNAFSGNFGSLTELSVVVEDTDGPEETKQALERFLKASTGLCHITVDIHPMLDNKSLFRHSNTLKTLSLGTGRREEVSVYSVNDMGDILAKCPKLEELAINLPDQPLGDIYDVADDFRLRPYNQTIQDKATELEKMLVSH